MASLRKRGESWSYIYSDADGVRREHKGCSDRRVTEELARQAESEAAKVKSGLTESSRIGPTQPMSPCRWHPTSPTGTPTYWPRVRPASMPT